MMNNDVRWERDFPADPGTVFDAISRRSAGWLWPIEYEPREGGAEKGLTGAGGLVTAWQPGRLFRTRAEDPDGWFNQLEYRLAPTGNGTHVDYLHIGSYADDPLEYEQRAAHTAFYRAPHFLGLRTENSLIAVFGRDAWGGSVGISLHLFDVDANLETERVRWQGVTA